MSDNDNFDKDIVDAQVANLDNTNQTETTDQTNQEATPAIDYELKFKESAKEAQRLYHENQELLKAKAVQEETQEQITEVPYPGFEELDPEAQENLIAYTESIKKGTLAEVYKDPAIAHSRKIYNESVWNTAFQSVLSQYPELADSKEDFKSKYFNANNVPTNIDSILNDVAKIYLFDKSKETVAVDEKTREQRVDTERTTGGDRDVRSGRTLEDWQRLMQDNPAQFAALSKEYNADLASGKI
jgi:hypothetical protein